MLERQCRVKVEVSVHRRGRWDKEMVASQLICHRQFNLCAWRLVARMRPRWSWIQTPAANLSICYLFFNFQWGLCFRMTLASLQLDATVIKGRRVFHPLSRNQPVLCRQTRGRGEGGTSITTTSLKSPFVPYAYTGFFRIRLCPIVWGGAREEMRLNTVCHWAAKYFACH